MPVFFIICYSYGADNNRTVKMHGHGRDLDGRGRARQEQAKQRAAARAAAGAWLMRLGRRKGWEDGQAMKKN